jgi:hypothetical protein
MGTYNHKQVISDYANDRITAEMAVGHSLQHIDKLYDAQQAANIRRNETRSRIDALENIVSTLQKEVSRLTVLIDKFLPRQKFSGAQQKSKH